ncbi:MAG: TIGR02391 family protein [Solirubrobacterales bacterium]
MASGTSSATAIIWRMSAEIPPFTTRTLEQISRSLGGAVTGSQLDRLFIAANLRDRSGESTKWKRIHRTLEQHQGRTGKGTALIGFLHATFDPGGFSSSTEFEALRREINVPLTISGFEVRDDGRVRKLKAAKTLSEAEERADKLGTELSRRNVHPDVLKYSRSELLQDNYFHAVLEAAKSVAEKIRERTGLKGDGADLIDASCTLKHGMPPMAFNKLETESEQSEHRGLAMLCKGLFSTYRNPRAHVPRLKSTTSMAEALDMLTLASMLHRRIDEATVTPAAPAHPHYAGLRP